MAEKPAIVPVGQIEQSIFLIRGQKVILDADLALLYGVTTKRLNQQVRRNLERFPEDFMFQLKRPEARNLRLQIATLSYNYRTRIHLPLAFAEHGAIMAASVLKSPQAVKVSVFVVRAFVKLREMLATHKEFAQRLDELERNLQKHDRQILSLVQAIRELMSPPEKPRTPIGFASELRDEKKPVSRNGAV